MEKTQRGSSWGGYGSASESGKNERSISKIVDVAAGEHGNINA
jgi:hypothetical protein